MMRMRQLFWWLAVGVGLIVTGACGDGGATDGAVTPTTTASPAVTASPITTSPITTSPVATSPVATSPVATTVPGTEPVDQGQPVGPRLKVTPSRATAGTRVTVEGTGFTGVWQGEASLWLSDPNDQSECRLLAEVEHAFLFADDGGVTGTFVVPERGVCRLGQGAAINVGPGDFDIMFRCSNDCRVGKLAVIFPGESTEEPTGARCDVTVNFGGGENLAGDVFADGLSCADAEAFLRANAAPLGPLSGPAHLDADGFACDRTGQSDVHLPRANYKCTRGSQAIFFIRT